ncbi:MAG TPA: phospholipid carrier-dependent glycosyltransferase [Thermoanaerobaculia bacterium]|jgi:4-amino-4-deoxy-L-arabinose transferase-like glycosyltransferase|nr:phospholipid carrier-dependent glycosyltransferase [Thermoanaerobaculia bacterium]
MSKSARRGLLLVALWAVVVGGGLVARPAWPIDETRYLGVAWEMFNHGELLVPHLNGVPYSDKPPLLFWLIVGGWHVFGVHEWWARLVPALFALGSLFLTARLARKLWPDRPAVADAAPLLLLSTFLWSFYTTVLLFDMMLVLFTLVGILGLVRAAQGERGGWLPLAAATALGILAKGPAILIWLVPSAICAPWWSDGAAARPGRWYPRAAGAFAAGIALALAWAIPAALSGGRAYADAILWNQTAGRVANAFAHRRPFWWYLPLAPLLVLPWLLWPAIWRGTSALRSMAAERGVRLCAVWSAAAFVSFSLVSGKQIHYLLPLLPPLALVGARLLSAGESPVRRRGLAGVALCFFLFGAVLMAARPVADDLALPYWVDDLPSGIGIAVASLGVLLLLLRPRSRVASLQIVAACSVAALVLMLAAIGRTATPLYDVGRVARYLGRLEQDGHPLAHAGKYRGEYHFAGRLKRPLEVIESSDVERWFSRHPDGYVVVYSRRALIAEADDELRHDYRGGVVAVRHSLRGSGSKFQAPGSR